MSYLKFVDAGTSPSGKTKVWNVVNTKDEQLGSIFWYAPWRKYVAQLSGLYDPDCLEDISQFLRTKTLEHRNG